MEMLLSWTVVGHRGGNKKNPSWQDVEMQLLRIAHDGGSVTVDLIGAGIGPQSLQVQSENGYFVLMLGEETENDHFVRTITRSSAEPTKIEILGNCWDSRIVCESWELVAQTFEKFTATGDVSRELLS